MTDHLGQSETSGFTDLEAKSILVQLAYAEGATLRFFEADGGQTGCELNWGDGHRFTAFGTTRECIDRQLRELGRACQ